VPSPLDRTPTARRRPAPPGTLEEDACPVAPPAGPDLESGTAAALREAQLTKPAGALGRLEALAAWLAAWQGRHPPVLRRPRTAVFAANHGVAARAVSAYPAAVTAQMVANSSPAAPRSISSARASTPICGSTRWRSRRRHGTSRGTGDDEAECAQAMAYGMMAVEPASTCWRSARWALPIHGGGRLVRRALGGSGALLVGREPASPARRWHARSPSSRRRWRCTVGTRRSVRDAAPGRGLELAAIAGAVMAARLARVPVVLGRLRLHGGGRVPLRRRSARPRPLHRRPPLDRARHSRLLARIGQEPLLDLGMRLGEGSGATLAIAILKAAVACHTGMATFAEAGVSTRAN